MCTSQGMKVNTPVCALKTPQCVHMCVHESLGARGGGSNCIFGLLALGVPRCLGGGHLSPESCMLTRPDGGALVCLFTGQ